MNDIICPNCKKAFKVDEAGFADILKQVRDHQFEEELKNRLDLAAKDKESAVKLAEATIKNSLQEQLNNKDKELAELKAQKEIELSKKIAEKESELLQVKSKLENAEVEKKLAITEATQKVEKERDDLANIVKIKDTEKQLLEKSISEKYQAELKEKVVRAAKKTGKYAGLGAGVAAGGIIAGIWLFFREVKNNIKDFWEKVVKKI